MLFLRPVGLLATGTTLVLLALLPAMVQAQTLPNHLDPSARDEPVDTISVPAIRFLTTADFPPFNYRDENGQLVGFNVDLATAICDVLGATCTLQAWPWAQAADALGDNQGDALIAGLALTPENGERFRFSQIYLMLPARFVTQKARIRLFEPDRLTGQKIAVRAGSAHQSFAQKYLAGVEIVPFDSEIAALEALAEDQVTAYFGDGMRASFWLNANPDCCGFAGPPYFRPDLFGEGFAIAISAANAPLRQAIDQALTRLKKNGRFDDLYLRWFPVSFY